MHQEKCYLSMNPIAKWYNFAFVTRWIVFLALSLLMDGKPRTSYTIFVILDVCLLAFSIVCLKSFMNCCGILIVVEEVLVLIWHAIMMFWFYGAPNDRFEAGTVKFFSYVHLIAYILCMIIEIILLFAGGKMCFKPRTSTGIEIP